MTREEAIKKLEFHSELMHRMSNVDELTKAIDVILADINNQWISVEERNPDTPNIYIVSDGNKVTKAWWSDYGFWLDTTFNVTHWMPFPPPPSGDKL